ncbi:hypothetical protein GLYMA_19G066500v4 [Glycine max]|nr:uncharacterized protein LOC113000470 isoform X1 [Glycine max]XP_040868914.1 uncharacterized protein LOC113000470 isoform X1 [Glycine max]KAG4395905.1 hypothetical protein GLYMA_19G066500v4 [Glycine max]KAH1076694.1 hypothetical protein GYH30_052277 [Glycine max]|eukprot:XP_025982976.1 uncharacterized protein LOC113000470 [Glycine max]
MQWHRSYLGQETSVRRVLLFMLYGFAYSGPFGHFLHKLMDKIFKGEKGLDLSRGAFRNNYLVWKRKPAIMQFRATFHNDRDIIKVPFFYHIRWAPKYLEYVRFKYNGAIYQIQVRLHKGKVFFAEGLKQFRKELAIYESTIIHFFAIDHILVFDLHFSPPLEQQTSERSWMISMQHIWTLEITQSMIDALHPLNLSSCVTRHLNGCDQHMTILRRLGPPLQWNVIVLDIGWNW